MGKRWRKAKAGTQQPKRRRGGAPAGGSSGAGSGAEGSAGGSSGRGSGLIGGMRGGLKWMVGAGPKPKTAFGKILDAGLWLAVVVVAYVVVSNRCGG